MLEPRENHSRNPEENYVVARNEHVAGVEIFEVGSIVGIAEGRERPQRRGEPGVENVLVLRYVFTAAVRALGNIGL